MNSIYFFTFLFALVLFNPVQSEVCDFDDKKCILEAANNFYDDVVDGNEVVESSDPLYYDQINGQIKCFKYQFTDIKMTGLKDCEGIKSVIQNTSQDGVLQYQYDVFCPKLVLEYYYEGKGKLGSVDIDGKGFATLTITKYVLIFTGKFIEFISDEDYEPHLTMEYNRIKTDPRGKLTLEAESLSKDKRKVKEALEYINSHWDELEKYFSCSVMAKLMDKFNARQNEYLITLPVDAVFST